MCDNALTSSGVNHLGIAHQHIKERRARKTVPVGPGGNLGDYVPFYFSPRSPMLCAIHNGSVEGYDEGQTPILHLVSSAESVARSGLAFAFTDGHAEMAISDFFDDLRSLKKIDWEIMKAKWWYDTLSDNDRKRRRQAEFLVHDFFPWSLVAKVGVLNRTIEGEVNRLIQRLPHCPEVSVERNWYY